ncbi:MAG: hypothetical protein ACHP82_00385 [Hyphomicrobiales bacterium]
MLVVPVFFSRGLFRVLSFVFSFLRSAGFEKIADDVQDLAQSGDRHNCAQHDAADADALGFNIEAERNNGAIALRAQIDENDAAHDTKNADNCDCGDDIIDGAARGHKPPNARTN